MAYKSVLFLSYNDYATQLTRDETYMRQACHQPQHTTVSGKLPLKLSANAATGIYKSFYLEKFATYVPLFIALNCVIEQAIHDYYYVTESAIQPL